MEYSKEFYENNKLMNEGNIKDGFQEGHWVFYYENGKIFRKGEFKKGEPIGEWIEYFENASIKYIAIGGYFDFLVEDLDNIVIKKYYDESGKTMIQNGNGIIDIKNDEGKKIIISFQNGVKEGVQQEFGENGKLIRKVLYKKGKKEGKLYAWYPNGNLSIEIEYKDGEEKGEVKEFYENGKIKEEGKYNRENIHLIIFGI